MYTSVWHTASIQSRPEMGSVFIVICEAISPYMVSNLSIDCIVDPGIQATQLPCR